MQEFTRDLRKGLKDTWLRFANVHLRNSGNEFLERFAAYLEEGYKNTEQNDCIFREPSWATKQQSLLMKTLAFEDLRLPSMQDKGYALIGKTDFDKLEFIKNYFKARGLSEFAEKRTGGHFVVVDCSRVKRYDSFIRILEKNKDVPYVIFDHCDSLLKHDYVLQAIKILAEASEHSFYSGLSIISRDGDVKNFKTESYYIFLGEENTLPIAVEKEISKGLGESAYNHFYAFVHYCVHVYDFDKGERYYGHEVIHQRRI